ncbi:hypothetical protein BC936DRAFT_140432 [Jimgerdemannia flammicorona]|uniref:Uncharacterized protein n=1 Tax=Jimgerdemannia flammicorona TaxID=994334 RepID=A0A433ATX6_9FUNG|nr:hypothetical protein BC936DRAFT_140432 [Jimgerdemannia flammicorona]
MSPHNTPARRNTTIKKSRLHHRGHHLLNIIDNYGRYSEKTVSATQELAKEYTRLGQYEKALNLYKKISAIQKKIPAQSKYPHRSRNLERIAEMLCNLNRHTESREYYIQALNIQRANLGVDDTQVIQTMLMIATSYCYERRFDDGVDLCKRILDMQTPPDSLKARTLMTLGVMYSEQDEHLDESESCYRRAADIFNALGEPLSGEVFARLMGDLSFRQRRYIDAENHYTVLRNVASDKGMALLRLCIIYRKLHRFADGERAGVEAIVELADTVHAADAYMQLGLLYLEWCNLDKAEELLAVADKKWDITRQRQMDIPVQHLTDVYIERGNFAKAAELQIRQSSICADWKMADDAEQCLARAAELLRAADTARFDIAVLWKDLGKIWLERHPLDRFVEMCFDTAFSIVKDLADINFNEIVAFVDDLLVFYVQYVKYGQKTWTILMDLYQIAISRGNRRCEMYAVRRIVGFLMKYQRYRIAECWCCQLVEIQKCVEGYEHENTINALIVLATIYQRLDLNGAALRCWREIDVMKSSKHMIEKLECKKSELGTTLWCWRDIDVMQSPKHLIKKLERRETELMALSFPKFFCI